MFFKNLETGMTWEVSNTDRIKELKESEKYTCVSDEELKTKTSTKKKESK